MHFNITGTAKSLEFTVLNDAYWTNKAPACVHYSLKVASIKIRQRGFNDSYVANYLTSLKNEQELIYVKQLCIKTEQ